MRRRLPMARATWFILTLLCGATLLACEQALEPEPTPLTGAAWLEAHSADYLSQDSSWRRARLEETLWRPELRYSQKLLDHYGLQREGWDLLPPFDFEVEPVVAATARELSDVPFAGEPISRHVFPEQEIEIPEDSQQWRQLGEGVFWLLPMRRDSYMEWLVRHPEQWERFGLEVEPSGNLRGVVRYRDARGDLRVGMTCGLCHGATGEAGRAARTLDLGAARAAFHTERGLSPAPFDQWGAGKVDVTDDAMVDAMAIPNLWGMSHQRYFNASGVVQIASPASAAVRFETQYIMNHGYEVRPPRQLIWALAIYLYQLEPPTTGEPPSSEALRAGEAVFSARCASCHAPEAGFSGGLIAASALTSEPEAAASLDRGTGSYRVPSLLGISRGGPYLHDGSQPTLEALLATGHPFGEPLAAEEQERLLVYLNTL